MTRTNWLPDAATFALLATFLGAIFLVPAEGQTGKQAGVGLPGVPRPDFHHSWCEQKRPPGRQATCTAKAPADFDCRICPANGWSGYYAEFYQRTTEAMRGAWLADFWGTRATHDGAVVQSSEPTPGVLAAEFSWIEVTYPRTHEIYRRFWYEAPGREGGTAASPIAINLDTLRFNLDRIDCMKALGAWPAPGATGSYIGFDPVYPTDVCANRFPPPGARPLWPVWVRNALPVDHPVNGGSLPPPPSPAPAPAPSPLPPTPPPCTSWPISGWLEQCGKLAAKSGKDLAGAELCGWCAAKSPAPETVLARLRGLVCEPVVCETETPPPPEPVPVPPPPPPIESCIQCDLGPFRPGIPSTGLSGVVVQVVCRWIECPEVPP